MLVVLLLVFGGAMLREVNLLMVLTGMLLGMIVFSWRALVVTLRGLEIQRSAPPGVCAGDQLVVGIHVKNVRRRVGSWALVVEEEIQRENHSANGHSTAKRKRRGGAAARPWHASVFFPYVPAGGEHAGAYRGRLTQRGRYLLGPLKVSTRFPFGLLGRTRTIAAQEPLMVFPRLGRLTRHWLERQHEAFAGTHRRERQPGLDGDFYGVRPWRAGDSRRWIHWRSTARTGELVVRQFEQPRNRDLTILLDLWQPASPEPQHDDAVELAVSFVATVVADLCRRGESVLSVGMAAASEVHWMRGPTSAVFLQDVMEDLALVEPHEEGASGPLMQSLLQTAMREIEPGTEMVLVSTRPIDVRDAEVLRVWAVDTSAARQIRQIRCIDTSSDALAEFFRPE